jgi:hypothetical protein
LACRIEPFVAEIGLERLDLFGDLLQVVVDLVRIVATAHGGELAAADLVGARQQRKIEIRHGGEPPDVG